MYLVQGYHAPKNNFSTETYPPVMGNDDLVVQTALPDGQTHSSRLNAVGATTMSLGRDKIPYMQENPSSYHHHQTKIVLSWF